MTRLTPQHQSKSAYGRVRQVKAAQRSFPSRQQFLLREAARLARLKIRGCEVEFYNPRATGRKENHEGTWQWVDLMASHPRLGLLAIDIVEKDYRFRERFAEEKRKGLADRGIPYLVCQGKSLSDLQAEIIVWIMKMERDEEAMLEL